jgi:phospholipid-transporting ATPase
MLKIVEDEYFPCDMVILSTSDKKGTCFIETKNLDGETNLKQKGVDKDASKFY